MSTITAISAPVGTTCQVTLTVSSNDGIFSETRSVLVQVVSSSSPSINLFGNKLVNAPGIVRVHIQASIIVSTEGLEAIWIVDDNNLDLQSLSLTPVENALHANTVTSFSLLLPENSLSGGQTYTFSLICRNSASLDEVATASLAVYVNSPPLQGHLAVTPHTGTALSTDFMFIAFDWLDQDLPLSFAFGFSEAQNNYILQDLSEISYGVSQLPSRGDNRNITCFTQVVDVLGANTTATDSVFVVLGDSGLNNIYSSLVDLDIAMGVSGRVDYVKQIISNG